MDDDYSDLADRASAPAADDPYAELSTRASGKTVSANGAPEAPPIKYDAALFKQRVGRAPNPGELESFASTKGQGWLGDPGVSEVSPVGVAVDRLLGGTARGIVGGYKGIGSLLTGGNAPKAVESITSQQREPSSTAGKKTAGAIESPYNPLNYIDESGQFIADKAADAGAPPIVSTGLRILPDAVAAYLGLRHGSASSEPATMAEPEVTANAPHPLAEVAESEASRLASAREAGVQAGLDLPDRVTAPQVRASNNMVAQELNLPPDKPITQGVLSAARKEFGSPAYEAVSKVSKIQLGTAYEDAIEGVDLSRIDESYRPPEGGSITGERAVDLSRYLRKEANKYYAAAKGNPEFEKIADAHWDAAEAVEDAVERRLRASGNGQLATNWDNARTYIAKTYSVQNALDGAGNVVVPALKRQLLKNKPLSGNLETLATLGAMYPDAFKNTPAAPTVGVGRQAVAAAIRHLGPPAAGAAGSALGPLGAAGGVVGGKVLSDRIANRIAPP